MSDETAEHSTHYRQSNRDLPALRIPGSGWAWFLGIPMALVANYALHQVAMSWWFSEFTGVLPGDSSGSGWWSVCGTGLRWCLALAVWFTIGAGLSHLTRGFGRARTPVTVWCFRRSAPSLKLGLGLFALIAGGVLYAAFDGGENPSVDSQLDAVVASAFWIATAVAGALAVIYFNDLVRVELRDGHAVLHTETGHHPVIGLRALAVDRFVVRTSAFSETYFLAGWFSRGATRLVGAYAVQAACAPDEAAEVASEAAAPRRAGYDVFPLAGVSWPWWVGGAAGLGVAVLAAGAGAWTSGEARQLVGLLPALAPIVAWLTAVLVASAMTTTRFRKSDDTRPIRFRLLLAEARRKQHIATIPWVRTIAIGALLTVPLVGIALGLSLVLGGAALILLAPLMVLYLVVTHPGIWFLLVNAVRLVRDGRTLEVDATGAWLSGRRVTACESVGGAVVVYTGLEPTWLRVASMSRDVAQWKSEADAIAAYVQHRTMAHAA